MNADDYTSANVRYPPLPAKLTVHHVGAAAKTLCGLPAGSGLRVVWPEIACFPRSQAERERAERANEEGFWPYGDTRDCLKCRRIAGRDFSNERYQAMLRLSGPIIPAKPPANDRERSVGAAWLRFWRNSDDTALKELGIFS